MAKSPFFTGVSPITPYTDTSSSTASCHSIWVDETPTPTPLEAYTNFLNGYITQKQKTQSVVVRTPGTLNCHPNMKALGVTNTPHVLSGQKSRQFYGQKNHVILKINNLFQEDASLIKRNEDIVYLNGEILDIILQSNPNSQLYEYSLARLKENLAEFNRNSDKLYINMNIIEGLIIGLQGLYSCG